MKNFQEISIIVEILSSLASKDLGPFMYSLMSYYVAEELKENIDSCLHFQKPKIYFEEEIKKMSLTSTKEYYEILKRIVFRIKVFEGAFKAIGTIEGIKAEFISQRATALPKEEKVIDIVLGILEYAKRDSMNDLE